MIYFFYNLVLYTAWPLYRVAARFQPRIRLFQQSRSEGRAALLQWFAEHRAASVPLYWLHGSSVGELDQALAQAREIRNHEQHCQIVLTCFSLSARPRVIEGIDLFCYLPLDFSRIWKQLVLLRQPAAFITMTWDLFPNLIRVLSKAGTRVFLASASISAGNWRLRPLGSRLFQPVYRQLKGIGAVNAQNCSRFKTLMPVKDLVQKTGDSRFDAIFSKLEGSVLEPAAKAFFQQWQRQYEQRLILASTYDNDEELLIPILSNANQFQPDCGILIFAHHIDQQHLQRIADRLTEYQQDFGRLSQQGSTGLDPATSEPALRALPRWVLVDQMGLLAQAYRYCDFCYVGGGFQKRVHNVAEAAALAKPVITGPNIDWSGIALELEALGSLQRCHTSADLQQALSTWYMDRAACQSAGKKAAQYLASSRGASKRFYQAFLDQDQP
ncbi:MAG: hypothetical protein KDK39_13700 [Leptospiraceae bacterium]|nr:hypothetical protein [Leptospiraceae bacterium]